jgi:hypothetical protein
MSTAHAAMTTRASKHNELLRVRNASAWVDNEAPSTKHAKTAARFIDQYVQSDKQ